MHYTWAWGTDVSRGQDQEDLTVVAVIDGGKVMDAVHLGLGH